jgi:membrane protein YdbS with pleckstrin-like domain
MFTKEVIENYFLSFKHEHLFLLMLAGLSLIVGLVFYFAVKKHFYKGFAIPLFSAAMLLFTIAFSNFRNADRIRKICVYDYDLHPENLKIRELVRVDSFMLNANIIFYTSIVLLIAAAAMFLYFRKKLNSEYIKGAAASLFLMALVTVITFFIIKKEAKVYKDSIVEFTKDIRIN